MKGKRRIVVIICVMILCASAVMFSLPLFKYSYSVYRNWKYSLPITYQEVYGYEESSFNGDGYRYHVFQYRKSKEAIEKLYAGASVNEDEDTINTDRMLINEWLDEIDVPENVRPDYSACLWQSAKQEDGSVIYLLWNPEIFTLYIVERFQ